MQGNTLLELAVLGIVAQGPVPRDAIARTAKSLMPELWSPTLEVIEAAVGRGVRAGHLTRPAHEHQRIGLTSAGAVRLRGLLLRDPGGLDTPTTLAVEAMQFCCLDHVDQATARRVLDRLVDRLTRRLDDYERRLRRCPHDGRFTRLWMGIEQRRLRGMVRVLADIATEGHAGPSARRACSGAAP